MVWIRKTGCCYCRVLLNDISAKTVFHQVFIEANRNWSKSSGNLAGGDLNLDPHWYKQPLPPQQMIEFLVAESNFQRVTSFRLNFVFLKFALMALDAK